VNKSDLNTLLSQDLSGEELLKRLDQDEATDDTREVWLRLAVLLSFDFRIYKAATKDLPVVPGFGEIVSRPGTWCVDEAKDRHAVTPERRADLLTSADRPSPPLQEFARRLCARFDKDGLDAAYDALAVGLLADADGGANRFKRLYAEADSEFRLRDCAQLLEILRARLPLLGLDAVSLWEETDAYYRSRAMFADDYYRSASYLHRQQLEQEFEGFWGTSDAWLLNIFGRGGHGKTMFVRWLIARRCLPRNGKAAPIAVARIDFDQIRLDAFAAMPWLVLVLIARQLSAQLPGNPFLGLVSSYSTLLPVLTSNEMVPESMSKSMEGLRPIVEARFRDGLAQSGVAIVLDTCEEPLLHRPNAFEGLLDTFNELRITCSGLRLLVVGRYKLEDRGLTKFAAGSTALEAGRFTAAESKEFLIKNRGMKAGQLVSAIVRQSGGNPFSLSLFADLAATESGLTIDDVEDAPRAEFVYLLDRVILRIPQPEVRWLVRYAAIPRLLTFDFASKVILPLLRDPSGDRANEFADRKLQRRYAFKAPWEPVKAEAMEEIWAKLRAYASNPSWVSWDKENDALKLQPEVILPMRQLLRQDLDLFVGLQRAAENYWLARARKNPAEYARAKAEAYFHGFHWDAATAKRWQNELTGKRLSSSAERMTVASVVLDRSFIDDKGNPHRSASGEPMLPGKLVLRGRIETAMAAVAGCLRYTRLDRDADALRSKLAEQWNALESADRSALFRAATKSEVVLARTGFAVLCQRALPPLAPLRRAKLPDEQRLVARLLAARITYERFFRGRTTTPVDFEKALELSAKLKSTEFPPFYVSYVTGQYFNRTANLERAIPAFQRAFRESLNTEEWIETRTEAFWRWMRALRLMGRWDEALAICAAESRNPKNEIPEMRFQILHAGAGVAMDLGRIDQARRLLDEAQSIAANRSKPAWFELSAELAIRSLEANAARTLLEEAHEAFVEGGLGKIRVPILRAASIRITGDLKAARTAIPKPYGYWELWIENVEERIRIGSPIPALFGRKVGSAAMRTRMYALALAHGRVDSPGRFFAELAKLDPEARLAALVPFGETGRVFERANAFMNKSLQVLPKAPGGTKRESYATQIIALANALRFFGMPEPARRMLQKLPRQDPFLEWQRLRALFHVGSFELSDVILELARFRAKHRELRTLFRLHAVEAAEWMAEVGEMVEAARLLESIAQSAGGDTENQELRERTRLVEARLAESRNEFETAANLYREAANAATASLNSGRASAARYGIKRMRRHSGPAEKRKDIVPKVDEWAFATQSHRSSYSVRFELVGKGGGRFVHPAPPWLSDPKSNLDQRDAFRDVSELAERSKPFMEHFSSAPIRLRLEHGPLSGLPWEALARPDAIAFFRGALEPLENSETARWMQASLKLMGYDVTVNGWKEHPAFLAALAQFCPNPAASLHDAFRNAVLKRNENPLPPGIWLSEPNAEWSFSSKRGYALQSASLEDAYHSTPFQSMWRSASASSPPGIIHMAGLMHERTDGRIVLQRDPSGSYGPTLRSEWGDQEFASLTSLIAPNQVRPLIIVDVLGSPNRPEAMREGRLRNEMCARMFERGVARAVLGFGLIAAQHQRTCLYQLTHLLREGPTIGELHRMLLSDRERFDFPPALWTDDPLLPAYL